ncbi:dephospho-CoA kinase [Primorskyibacter marinus]|uniref:dephospho-CoA kinase n=1 Tax=Primorskyibacter marinus TaxID=1977320 RepID=UPI000E30940D|nr:dephospho-CoA kinase [Primorskyibacter marinus]
MTFRLGLTGSIGMGKSTTARLFAEEGCDIWDADAAVHRLYSGAAVPLMQAEFPDAIINGEVSREALKRIISADNTALKRIESIIHPLVREDRLQFSTDTKATICVFDIPLLFETNSQAEFDAVACVTVSPETQRQRVLDRGTMSVSQFEMILAQQLPIADKLARADYVVDTMTMDQARADVQHVVTDIKRRMRDA